MLNLIGRLFIKNSSQVENPTVRRAWGTLASVFGIIMNLLLFVAKFTVGVLFGSVAIRADGINNLSDAAGSLVSLISFKISAKPADRDHPFGHARIEYVASLIVSFFILFIGVDLVREAFGKLFAPLPVHFEIIAAVDRTGGCWQESLHLSAGSKVSTCLHWYSQRWRPQAQNSSSAVPAGHREPYEPVPALFPGG